MKDLKGFEKTIKGGQNIIKEIKSVKGNLSDIRKQWNIINPMAQKAPDTAKLMMKRDEFDKAIQPYIFLPEAKACIKR